MHSFYNAFYTVSCLFSHAVDIFMVGILVLKYDFYTPLKIYTFSLFNRRLYNPEIACGYFSDIKGDLSVVLPKRKGVK